MFETKICERCGKEFHPTKAKHEKFPLKKYCSEECYHLAGCTKPSKVKQRTSQIFSDLKATEEFNEDYFQPTQLTDDTELEHFIHEHREIE